MTAFQRGWLLPPASVLLIAGILIGRGTDHVVFPAAALAAALLAVLMLRGKGRFCACMACSLALGAVLGTVAFHPSLPAERDYEVRGIVCDEVAFGSFGQVRVSLSDVTLDGCPFSGRAYWTFYTDAVPGDLLPGRAVSFSASLYHPGGAVNPGGYNFRETLLQRGITVGLYGCDGLQVSDPRAFSFAGSVASLRHRFSASLIRTLGEETGSYASALLLGMRSLIPSEDRQAFSRLGIAHILSVSGFHVGVLIGALSALFRLLRLKQKIRIALFSVFLFLYAALCGFSQPVIRASVLLLLGLEGRLLNRPRSGLHLLCAVLFAMALLSPVQVTSASFILTFCAVFGVVWIAPFLRRVRFPRGRFARLAFESFAVTLAVQLGCLLPELNFFQRLPLLVFLVNLPATAVFSILILFFWLAVLLLPVPGLSGLLSGPLSRVTGLLLSGVRGLGSLPHLTLWIRSPTLLTFLSVALLFLGLCFFVRFRALVRAGFLSLGAVLLVVSLLPAAHTATEYIQFSSGNADAAVLYDRDRVYVFDTGENDAVLSGWLRARRLTPDAVILTHLHADHAGGLLSLIEDEIPVKLIYLPAGAELQDIHPDFPALLDRLRASGTEIRTLSRGDVIPLPSGTLTVLWPEKGKVRSNQNANHYSLVSRLNLKGTVLLQTGDLTGSYENYCSAPADILKAAHHGSASSTLPDFLSAVSPGTILLSCRQSSRLEAFRSRIPGIPVYGTPESGAITIRFDEGSYTVIPTISQASLH